MNDRVSKKDEELVKVLHYPAARSGTLPIIFCCLAKTLTGFWLALNVVIKKRDSYFKKFSTMIQKKIV